MRTSRIASLVAVGAISLSILASTASAIAASPRTSASIGTQLAMLKGSDTVASGLLRRQSGHLGHDSHRRCT